MKKSIACIILAAGEGTRMKSSVPKVLHTICGRPMISYVLDLVKRSGIKNTVIVVGHKQNYVKNYLPKGIKIAVQNKLLGTADAVKRAMPALKSFKGTVLVLYADNPLLKAETVKKLLKHHNENNFAATLLTAKLEDPSGYGRIVRDKCNCITKIIEQKEANDFEKEIKEINTGIICFDKNKLTAALKLIRAHNKKKEYYLTDAVEIFYQKGDIVGALKIKGINEALGVNSQGELARANKVMQRRILRKHLENGIRIKDPQSTFIDWDVEIGQDTEIYPFTVIERGAKIGKRCHIGPFCHLRENVKLGNDVTAGNFLEIVRSQIGDGTFIKHFSYVGDTFVGKSVNIGAGTVTANFDGKKKNRSIIKDGSFIGSDTVLVSPVKVGRNARTGAGSIVTKNSVISDGTTVAGVPAKILKRGK
ncbi:MAG: NTP transferase domain-containing protein [Candidatus Omnitrophica bacterium]|nr:NTP transferase domain-containing protein [Candidatus Omnitrophota bacterium]MDD5610092.1 NTP transferase domain-containing protein [Candidatus Omnitrophota bacterium]